jgi:AmiR/NasT family two-component response regulator
MWVESRSNEGAKGNGIEGLRQASDGSELTSTFVVLRLTAQEHERDMPGLPMAADELSNLKAVKPRHRHIEQDEVRPFPSDKLQPLRAVLGLDHLDPVLAQTHGAEFPDRSVVVDEKHARRTGPLAQPPIGLAAGGDLNLSGQPLQNVRRGNSRTRGRPDARAVASRVADQALKPACLSAKRLGTDRGILPLQSSFEQHLSPDPGPQVDCGFKRMPSQATEHMRVLIANERPDRLADVAAILMSLGHEVIAREVDVSQVGAATARERPDVALVGLGVSSEHALDLIDKIVHEATCPVIALLHAADPEFVTEAAKRGVFAYIDDDEPAAWRNAIEIVLLRFAEYHNLEGAFGRRALTERAKGILMERHSIEEAQAFELLRAQARRGNRKLVDIAQAVVDGHALLPKQT